MSEYNAGHYEVAHAQFLALAELGDCPSQFNLGAMALKGQGVPEGHRQRRRLAAGRGSATAAASRWAIAAGAGGDPDAGRVARRGRHRGALRS